jgi:hypothetical protein
MPEISFIVPVLNTEKVCVNINPSPLDAVIDRNRAMNVCIAGFGNIGGTLAGILSLNGRNVRVFTVSYNGGGGRNVPFKLKEMESDNELLASIDLITDDLGVAVNNVDMIIVTYPSFMLESFVRKVTPFLSKPVLFGIVPGGGGAEYITRKLLKQRHIIFGLDRTPYIARAIEKNRSVEFSKKKSVNVAAIPGKETARVAGILEELVRLPVHGLANYLAVSLTPSNAILHTSRLYTMFKEYDLDVTYSEVPYFYRDWTDGASKSLIALDKELERITLVMPELRSPEMKTIREHYESSMIEAMTDKIRSIPSLKNIPSPMKKISENSFIPDFTSRFFTEDVPFGLLIIKGFGLITNVDTPEADKIIRWVQKWLGKDYLNEAGRPGRDFLLSGVPQAYGIETLEDVYTFYRY